MTAAKGDAFPCPESYVWLFFFFELVEQTCLASVKINFKTLISRGSSGWLRRVLLWLQYIESLFWIKFEKSLWKEFKTNILTY